MTVEKVIEVNTEKIVDSLSRVTITTFAEGYTIANNTIGATLDLDLLNKEALKYFNSNKLSLVKNMSTADKEVVSKYLGRSLEKGWNFDKFWGKVRKSNISFENPRMRSMRIFRTEMTRAHNEGALSRYRNAKIKKIQFLANPTACEKCTPFDRQIYKLGEELVDIPVHIGCLCNWGGIVE